MAVKRTSSFLSCQGTSKAVFKKVTIPELVVNEMWMSNIVSAIIEGCVLPFGQT